jgi:hypothetical protein
MQRDSSLGGLSNSEIAMELFVSASIAKVHLVPVCSNPDTHVPAFSCAWFPKRNRIPLAQGPTQLFVQQRNYSTLRSPRLACHLLVDASASASRAK